MVSGNRREAQRLISGRSSQSRQMKVYAGFLEYTDHHVGDCSVP
jgi:arylsulfatase A-like enzyme